MDSRREDPSSKTFLIQMNENVGAVVGHGSGGMIPLPAWRKSRPLFALSGIK
jgi:hypothetical protein